MGKTGVKLRPSFTQITSVITHTGTQLELDREAVHAVQCVKELVLRYSVRKQNDSAKDTVMT